MKSTSGSGKKFVDLYAADEQFHIYSADMQYSASPRTGLNAS